MIYHDLFDSHVLFRLQRYVLLFKLKAKIVSICLVSGFLYGNDNDNENDDDNEHDNVNDNDDDG